ncbi:hypothetical protein Tco_0681421 [Tanacetum coccineum]|uniref:Uncharacterized protein n=1 Tax=Tanacetum coccineum TaxID=301880 RepID=A0ABQ4XND1_9ASTR
MASFSKNCLRVACYLMIICISLPDTNPAETATAEEKAAGQANIKSTLMDFNAERKLAYGESIFCIYWAMEHKEYVEAMRTLTQIGNTRIPKAQREDMLVKYHEESFEKCESCNSGKMTQETLTIESAVRILNMVPTKKVIRPPYENMQCKRNLSGLLSCAQRPDGWLLLKTLVRLYGEIQIQNLMYYKILSVMRHGNAITMIHKSSDGLCLCLSMESVDWHKQEQTTIAIMRHNLSTWQRQKQQWKHLD